MVQTGRSTSTRKTRRRRSTRSTRLRGIPASHGQVRSLGGSQESLVRRRKRRRNIRSIRSIGVIVISPWRGLVRKMRSERWSGCLPGSLLRR